MDVSGTPQGKPAFHRAAQQPSRVVHVSFVPAFLGDFHGELGFRSLLRAIGRIDQTTTRTRFCQIKLPRRNNQNVIFNISMSSSQVFCYDTPEAFADRAVNRQLQW